MAHCDSSELHSSVPPLTGRQMILYSVWLEYSRFVHVSVASVLVLAPFLYSVQPHVSPASGGGGDGGGGGEGGIDGGGNGGVIVVTPVAIEDGSSASEAAIADAMELGLLLIAEAELPPYDS